MQLEIVTYSTPDGEGRPRRYENVHRYSCPNGCPTGYYDFRHAYSQQPKASGRAERLGRRQRVAWTVTTLLVAFGIVALYALFMYAVGAMPIGAPWVRVALWVLTTAAFMGIGALIAVPPRRSVPLTAATAPASRTPASPAPAPANAPAGAVQKEEAAGAAETVQATGRATGA